MPFGCSTAGDAAADWVAALERRVDDIAILATTVVLFCQATIRAAMADCVDQWNAGVQAARKRRTADISFYTEPPPSPYHTADCVHGHDPPGIAERCAVRFLSVFVPVKDLVSQLVSSTA